MEKKKITKSEYEEGIRNQIVEDDLQLNIKRNARLKARVKELEKGQGGKELLHEYILYLIVFLAVLGLSTLTLLAIVFNLLF